MNFRGSDYAKVAPNALVAYLRRHGWDQVSYDELISVWRREGRDIVAPVASDLDDYEDVIESAVSRLAANLDRKPALVLQDLLAVVYDILELKNVVGLDALLAIPLQTATDTVQSLQKISTGAAYATAAKTPRGVVPPTRPPQVNEFVASLKFGPYTNGAPGYALFAPIPLGHQPTLWDAAIEPTPDSETFVPFERQVTAHIPQYIAAAMEAAIDARQTSTLEPFEVAVERGVTSTLLRGIRQLLKVLPEDHPFLEIEYSPLLYVEKRDKSVPLLSGEAAEVLTDAITFLESKEPLQVEEVVGPVVSLGRGADEPQGAITVTTLLTRRPQNIYIRLPEPEYNLAILAHQKRVSIEVSGHLRRDGRRLWLDEPTNFRLAREMEWADEDDASSS